MARDTPRRVAIVHLVDGVRQFDVEGDWPGSVIEGSWIYTHGINEDGTPYVKRGRKSGVEFLHYEARHLVTCTEVPEVIQALGLKEEYRNGDGQRQELDRPTRETERPESRAPAGAKRRSYFRRAGECVPIQRR